MGVSKRIATDMIWKKGFGSPRRVRKAPRGNRLPANSIAASGVTDIDEKLAGLEFAIQKKVVRKAMRRAAKDVIVPEAKARVPVDTGLLEQSIRVRAIKRSRTKVGVVVTVGEALFKGDTFYSGMIEFGTVKMEAQPFLRPAGYGNEAKIQRMIADDIRAALKDMEERPKP